MSEPKEVRNFTSNEVASLVEDLKGEFRAVAEGVSSLADRMDNVEGRLESLETKVDTLTDAVRITLPNHEKRIAKLEAKVGD